eukprot:SAG11_NODE_461_length_9234_cov_10.929611_7_plen_250_part_00
MHPVGAKSKKDCENKLKSLHTILPPPLRPRFKNSTLPTPDTSLSCRMAAALPSSLLCALAFLFLAVSAQRFEVSVDAGGLMGQVQLDEVPISVCGGRRDVDLTAYDGRGATTYRSVQPTSTGSERGTIRFSFEDAVQYLPPTPDGAPPSWRPVCCQSFDHGPLPYGVSYGSQTFCVDRLETDTCDEVCGLTSAPFFPRSDLCELDRVSDFISNVQQCYGRFCPPDNIPSNCRIQPVPCTIHGIGAFFGA